MEYISVREAAEGWGITPRRVEALCAQGRIHDVERVGKIWLIPKSASKPLDGRIRASLQQRKQPDYDYASLVDTERAIEKVNATMAMEGMPLSESDKDRLRAVLLGQTSANEMVRQLVIKHKDSAHAK